MFRVFEYGFGHAYQNRIVEKGGETLVFPEPRIVYLSGTSLQKLILYDIIGSINKNEELGNISQNDGYILKNLTDRLYFEIYSAYNELEEVTMRIDESLQLECDKYNLDEMQETINGQWDKIREQGDTIREQGNTIREQWDIIKELKATVEELKKHMAEKV